MQQTEQSYEPTRLPCGCRTYAESHPKTGEWRGYIVYSARCKMEAHRAKKAPRDAVGGE